MSPTEPGEEKGGWCHMTGSTRKLPRYGPSGEVVDPGWVRHFDRWVRFGLPPPDWKEPEERAALPPDSNLPPEPPPPMGFRSRSDATPRP